jgi:hypothetical protein
MNYKKILSLIIFLSLTSTIIILFVCYLGFEDFCFAHQDSTIFVLLFSAPLFLLSLILLFLRKEVYESWKKFALWWLPISFLFILGAPSSGGGSIGIGGSIDREIVTWWFAGLFFIISLVLIIYKSIKLRGK